MYGGGRHVVNGSIFPSFGLLLLPRVQRIPALQPIWAWLPPSSSFVLRKRKGPIVLVVACGRRPTGAAPPTPMSPIAVGSWVHPTGRLTGSPLSISERGGSSGTGRGDRPAALCPRHRTASNHPHVLSPIIDTRILCSVTISTICSSLSERIRYTI
jgi:hypothetical protein